MTADVHVWGAPEGEPFGEGRSCREPSIPANGPEIIYHHEAIEIGESWRCGLCGYSTIEDDEAGDA